MRAFNDPSQRMLALLLVALVSAVVGCGSSDDPFERVAVEGMVTVDGQPLETPPVARSQETTALKSKQPFPTASRTTAKRCWRKCTPSELARSRRSGSFPPAARLAS